MIINICQFANLVEKVEITCSGALNVEFLLLYFLPLSKFIAFIIAH